MIVRSCDWHPCLLARGPQATHGQTQRSPCRHWPLLVHAGVPIAMQQHCGKVQMPPAGQPLAVTQKAPLLVPPMHCFGHRVGVGAGVGCAVGVGKPSL